MQALGKVQRILYQQDLILVNISLVSSKSSLSAISVAKDRDSSLLPSPKGGIYQ